jgi:DNA polymerase eta
VTAIHEEQCEPSASEKENGKRYSAISAKQCPANEEKRISKKLPEVKVSCPFLFCGYWIPLN